MAAAREQRPLPTPRPRELRADAWTEYFRWLERSFHRLVRELAAEEGCDVIKSIGDAVMVRATNCRVAVRLAHRILALSAREGYPPVRIGLDTGPAIERDGDW